jgi:hypothetical protein
MRIITSLPTPVPRVQLETRFLMEARVSLAPMLTSISTARRINVLPVLWVLKSLVSQRMFVRCVQLETCIITLPQMDA